jgi:hypothetical protein
VTSVAFVVGKGKKEISRRVVEVDDGHEADVTFTMTPEIAAEVDAGTLDVSVGFMRGAIKMAGDFGALLRVLPVIRSTPARPARAPKG